MNVIISINVRWWNAEANYAFNLAKVFSEKGNKVFLISNPDSPVFEKAKRLDIDVIDDVFLDSTSPVTILKNYKKTKELVKNEKIEVIISFKSNGSFIFSLIRNASKSVVYLKVRGQAKAPTNNIFNRFLFGKKGCDALVCAGLKIKYWFDKLDLKQQLVRVFYFGSPILQIPKDTSKEIARKKLNLPKEKKIFALVGRTQGVKGHAILLKAFNDFIKHEKNAHLVFVVKKLDEFPEELSEIEHYIQEHELDKNVSIFGFLDNLSELYQAVDFCVIPSLDSEVICRVLVESFSTKTPVICFPTGCLPELVNDERNGFLCEEKTAESLTKNLFKAYQLDDDQYSKLSKKCFEDYEKTYSDEVMYHNFFSLIKNLKDRKCLA